MFKKILIIGVCLLPFSALAQTQIIDEEIVIEEIAYLPQASRGVASRTHHAKERTKAISKESLEEKYNNFKNALDKAVGLTYNLDISVLGQRGSPNGSKTAYQTQYYGSANWNMYTSAIGSGSMQFAYTKVQYWGTSGQDISDSIGVASLINDYPTNSHSFDQLTYTHQFPDKLNWLSVSLGQFPMYNFDGTAYDSNQQTNFLNYALSQNGSASYPVASLGGYATITPNTNWSFTVGFQDANNISGSQIETSDFHLKRYTSFVSASFTPTIKGLGQGQYSVLLYNQPWTQNQPETTNGWSVNVSQELSDKWAVFGRINGSTGSESIKQSYVLGAVYNNPLGRNTLDQIGFATAINKMNKDVNGDGTRSVETVLEGYWAWGISNFLTITPDIQFYINPALDTDNKTATVASLRATFMF